VTDTECVTNRNGCVCCEWFGGWEGCTTYPHASGLAAPGPVGMISPASSNRREKYAIV
jgi:hypothetical protein